MKESILVDVIINLPVRKIYTYKVEKKISIGTIIIVPFGYNNEEVYAITITDTYKKRQNFPIKNAISISSSNSLFSASQIRFLKWASQYYLVPLPKIINSIIPNKIFEIKKGSKEILIKNKQVIKDLKPRLNLERSDKYLQLLVNNIKPYKDKDSVVLILTPNLYKSFEFKDFLEKKYGKICLLYNSKLSNNEKKRAWSKVIKEKKLIIIGVKSAIFLPFKSLDKILILDENDHLYKENDRVLRYNARDCSIMLSKIHNCKIELISDSPSIESIHNVKTKKYNLINYIDKNNLKPKLKNITVINSIEKKIKKKIQGIISDELLEIIENYINENKRIVIITPYISDIENIKDQLIIKNQYLKIKSVTKYDFESKKRIYTTIKDLKNKNLIIGNHSLFNNLTSVNTEIIILLDPDKISRKTSFKSNEAYFQIIYKAVQIISTNQGKKLIIQLKEVNNKTLKYGIYLDYKGFIKGEMIERKTFQYSPYYKVIKIEISEKNNKKLDEIGNRIFKKLNFKFKNIIISNSGLKNKGERLFYEIIFKVNNNKDLRKNKKSIFEELEQITKKSQLSNYLFTIDVDP